MTTVNPTRLEVVPDPNLLTVNYNGTHIGIVMKTDDGWYYRDHGEVSSTTSYDEPQDAADALTQAYLGEQITMLADIAEVTQTFTRTLLDQPQPSNQQVLGQAKRLLSSLNEQITAYSAHIADSDTLEDADV